MKAELDSLRVLQGLAVVFVPLPALGAAIVTVTADAQYLRVEVADDGPGGASVDAGSGLRDLADRVDAAGGRFTVHGCTGPRVVVAEGEDSESTS